VPWLWKWRSVLHGIWLSSTYRLGKEWFQKNPLRAVYIGNKLYTISQSRVLVIDIDSRSVEAEIKLE
jgi:uncharacterized secreted protein with C-terminal beta-propeller domain